MVPKPSTLHISFLLLLGLLLGPASTYGQNATLRGFVTDASDGQPLPGVNVILTNAAGELYGTATDNDGFYAVSRVPLGTFELRATFIGYDTYAETLILEEGLLTKNLSLAPSETELEEVVVESERETAGAASLTAGLQTVRPADINLVPAPDISADLVNYLTALPGIVSQGDRGGQLFIRGGEPTQNMVLLDGMLIYQPFHVIGFFSAFPSDIINTADVYAGGFGGRFGGRLSSVIDISARTGNKQQFAGAVTAAPFVSTARLEGPIVPGIVSIIASVRESVIEQGAAKIVDDDLPFSFGDRFGKIHARLGPNAQMSISALQTRDRGRIGIDPLDESGTGGVREDEVTWRNEAYGLRFIFLPATFPVLAEILASSSRLENDFGPPSPSPPLRSTKVEVFNVAANVTHYLGVVDVNWGVFLTSSHLQSELNGLFQNFLGDEEYITEAGAFVEPEFRLPLGLRLQPSVRLQTFPSKSLSFFEPRLRVVWNAGMHRLSLAAGIYHQEILGFNDRRNAGDVFTAWSVAPPGIIPEAKHFIAGWRVSPSDWLSISLEGFYKKLTDLLVPEWTAFPRFTTNIQKANGTAIGGDARLEITTDVFYGVASYGLSDVEYESTFRGQQLLFGDDLTKYPPPHDRRHQVNVLANFSKWNFDLNVRYQFGSGLPFNQSLGFDRWILLDSLTNVVEEEGSARVLYTRPYTGRLPAYHRFDVSLDYEVEFSRRTSATIQAGVINVSDRRNLFYVDLFTLRRVDQLPLIPTVGIKLELK